MNAVVQSVGDYVALYPKLAASLPGGGLSWLEEKRRAALADFSSSGFPSPRMEEWKYTNVAPIERKRFKPGPVSSDPVEASWLEACRLENAWSLVFVDGRFEPALSRLEDMPAGVLVSGMTEALKSRPDQVRRHLGAAVDGEAHGFINFNTAYFSDGVFLCVAAGTVMEKPLQLIYLTRGEDRLAATRNLLIVERGAEACVVETYVGEAASSYLTAAVTEVTVDENARLTLYKVQAEGDRAFHFGGTYVNLARYGVFRHHNFSFGGLLVRNEVHAGLDEAADCALNGLYLGAKRQHVDNHTRVNHFKPHGISRELYKGIFDERARGVFQGRVIVHPDAQKTDSEMSNRNLLLSADAEADTKPQLEIYADDVKCAHGVTVGQLDEKSVFYLQSRAVDAKTARNMLTFAFANEMVEKIAFKGLRRLVQTQLLTLFPQKDIRKEWL